MSSAAYFPLKRAGSAFKALCPFHQEKSPSFTVNPQRQRYHCFGCGEGGSVFDFVAKYESVDFPTAARRLAERAGIRDRRGGALAWRGSRDQPPQAPPRRSTSRPPSGFTSSS